MRSPVAPILAVAALAAVVVLAVAAWGVLGMRGDLDRVRSEVTSVASAVASLEAQVAEVEPGVDEETLQRSVDALESSLRDWLIATGNDGFDPDGGSAGDGATASEILDRLDDVLGRLRALEERLDEICEGVPVC